MGEMDHPENNKKHKKHSRKTPSFSAIEEKHVGGFNPFEKY